MALAERRHEPLLVRHEGTPVQERLDQAGSRYAATLLGVSRLARPELLVELEAMAAA